MDSFSEGILGRAKFIQFPLTESGYKDYSGSGYDIIRLPLVCGSMYRGWRLNSNHFRMSYHMDHVLPLLEGLLGFNVLGDSEGFAFRERFTEGQDVSFMCPRRSQSYLFNGLCLDDGKVFSGIGWNELTSSSYEGPDLTGYHKLFLFPHRCCVVDNLSGLDNGRNLLVSGDSQMIPVIGLLCCIFRKVVYLDNRTGRSFRGSFQDICFDDVLVELNCNPIEKYTIANLK